MNEKRIDLPSGGIVYITARPSHEQATALRRHSLKIARYIGPTRDAEGRSGGTGWRTDLTSEQLDEKDALILESPRLHIRTLTRRWENVNDAEGGPLSFPDDIARMSEEDFDALFEAVTAGKEAEGNAPPQSESG